MAERSRWAIRAFQCPEGRGQGSLLLEWQVEKAKMVLNSVHCKNPRLMNYGGEDCEWRCIKKLEENRG